MLRRALLGCVCVATACSREPPAPPAPPAPSSTNELWFTGACDASGAVSLDDHTFLVADDEDNVLRVYDALQGGPPLAAVDMSAFLELPVKRKGAPEVDIEAATRIGDRAYFISSHGRNSAGKLMPERVRFFATTAPISGKPQLVGRPYEGLLRDLLNEDSLSPFELAAAAELPPKAPGGLNIEGMTERREGGAWLGFRNPLPRGRALLVPLLNPERLIEGERARFGEPTTLDLGGLGVRALSFWRGRYLIAAGPFDTGGTTRLFQWDGRASAIPLGADVQGYNPEAFFTPDARERILLLSDDGSLRIDGKECKRLHDPSRKRFRGTWLRVP